MPRPQTIALIVACALFMENLDGTIITTALPQIAADFGVNPVHLSLSITSYLLGMAAFIPISGWLADKVGARDVFRAAIVVFVLASVACGSSVNLPMLATSRFVQGIAGAMMMPVGRLVLLRNCTKAELVQALTYVTMPAMIGPIVGPPLGGFIATYADWRWIFFLNVPVGILGFILVSLKIPQEPVLAPPPLDIIGFLICATALSGLVMGVELVGRSDESPAAGLALLGIGAVAGAIYLVHAGRRERPILQLRLLRIPTFGLSVFGGSIFRIGGGALPLLLPLLLQVGFGKTAFAAGLLTFIGAVGAFAMKFTARGIIRAFGFRAVLIGNGVISAGLTGLYGIFRPESSEVLILVILLASGFFRSLQFTSLNALAFADMRPEDLSQATSVSGTAQQVAQSLGVALGASALHLTLAAKSTDRLDAADFWPAFLAVAAVTLVSALVFFRLERSAAQQVSGHGG
ncbi:MAG: MFS transporter [Alphaproteobacteria bacterium]|nr:MFS transporter [Alphaproteobacteria bacterium]